MADTKISALTSATTPLAGTEVLPIVQSSTTVKVAVNNLTVQNIRANATTGILQVTGPTAASTRVVTVPDANFTAARTDAAQSFTGDQTLSTGNIIQGTAAKGINFTANTGAAGKISQLLNWYEDGTFTPVLEGSTTAGTGTYTVQAGWYTRIGNRVFIQLTLRWTAHTGTGNMRITGLPFTSNNSASVATLYTCYFNNIALTAGYYPLALQDQGTTTINLRQGPTGGGAAANIPMDTAGDIEGMSGNYRI